MSLPCVGHNMVADARDARIANHAAPHQPIAHLNTPRALHAPTAAWRSTHGTRTLRNSRRRSNGMHV
eukprot:2456563-Lingulodinium_polyedra.AAC.1